jgi:hypothetical protein
MMIKPTLTSGFCQLASHMTIGYSADVLMNLVQNEKLRPVAEQIEAKLRKVVDNIRRVRSESRLCLEHSRDLFIIYGETTVTAITGLVRAPTVAVMLELPAATPVARPEALMVTLLVSELPQVIVPAMAPVVPLE